VRYTHTRRAWARILAVVLAVVGAGLMPVAHVGTASAAPGDVGYRGFQYAAGLGGGFIDPDLSPTSSKPQSKLWYAEGSWWGTLKNMASGRFHIYKYDTGTHAWTDTGVVADAREGIDQTDVLYDGSTLYVAGHSRPGAGSRGIRVSKFTYSGGAWTAGTFETISNSGIEAAVITKDSTGRLWVAYTAAAAGATRQVRVLVSGTNQAFNGAAPFTPVAAGSTVTNDDIASITAHGGQISLVWSNQTDQVVYAATHPVDAAPTAQWSAATPIHTGPRAADDHLNIQSVEGAPSGRVFVIVKEAADDTSPTNPSAPLIRLLVLNNDDTWSKYTHSTVAEDQTRPIVLLEPANDRLHVLATGPVAGGVVYKKTTSMSSPDFAPGRGEEFIKLASDTFINNPSSTKQHITDDSGMLVLATDQRTGHYVHNYVNTDGTTPPPASGPAVTLQAPSARFTRSLAVSSSWTTQAGSVPAVSYQLERRVVRALGGWSSPQVGAAISETSQTVNGKLGATYCMRVRGTAGGGTQGAFSNRRCTAVPLDDRNLTRRGPWATTSPGSAYLGTSLSTTRRGAALVKRVTAKNISLVVTKVRGGGVVQVFRNGRPIKRISLAATSTRPMSFVKVASTAKATTATYRVVVISRGKRVVIDGLGVSRM
jgi:hypothetical protein